MKKIFVITILFFLSILSRAGTLLIDRESENNTIHLQTNLLWKEYISCSLDHKNMKKCLDQTLSKSLNSAERTKLFELITIGFEVSNLKECSSQESEAFAEYSKKTYLCFKLYGNKTERTGYCFFDRIDNELRITRIKY